jgi:hypothetical protein
MRYLRQILVALIGLGMIVFIFVLIMRGFNSNSTPVTKNSTQLVSYASSDATSVLYIDGPINYDAGHRTLKLTVGMNQITADLVQGYQGTVIQSLSYPNNQPAYAIFLQSLQKLNFNAGNNNVNVQDERGYCPSGDRYIYQFMTNGTSKFRFWSTSCGQGTFSGSRAAVRGLFYAQFPSKDFSKVTSDLSL